VIEGVPPEGVIVRKAETAYTPPYSRGGSQAVFALDLLDRSVSGVLDVDIEHKNSDETTWASAGAFSSMSSTGMASVHVDELKEQIRLKLGVTGGLSWAEWVRVKLLDPSWQY
jgi:hypothetical protein